MEFLVGEWHTGWYGEDGWVELSAGGVRSSWRTPSVYVCAVSTPEVLRLSESGCAYRCILPWGKYASFSSGVVNDVRGLSANLGLRLKERAVAKEVEAASSNEKGK